MTIIIGIETPIGTIIAGDRRLTSAGLKFPGRPKVFRNGDILYGISGDGGVISKLRYGCDLPRKFSPGEDQEQWAYSKLIPVLQEAVPDNDSAWEMIVATKSEIISVDDSFDIVRSTKGYYRVRIKICNRRPRAQNHQGDKTTVAGGHSRCNKCSVLLRR